MLAGWSADPDGPMAVLMGLSGQRFLLKQHDLTAASDEEIVAMLAPAVRVLLGGR